jgi:hypothetical protein
MQIGDQTERSPAQRRGCHGFTSRLVTNSGESLFPGVATAPLLTKKPRNQLFQSRFALRQTRF